MKCERTRAKLWREGQVVAKAKRLLRYRWTPEGAVRAYLHHFKMKDSDLQLKKLAALVRKA